MAMNMDRITEFIISNLDYFTEEDLNYFINWEYNKLFDSFQEKYKKEKDSKKKAKYEEIVEFLLEFLEEYKKYWYKFNYSLSEKPEHFEYWFDFYFDNYLISDAEKVLEDIKKKFWENSLYKKLKSKLDKYKQKYEKEYNKLKEKFEYQKSIRSIESLISAGKYQEAMHQILEMMKQYPNDKTLEQYLKRIDSLRSSKIYEDLEKDIEFFKKLWLADIIKVKQWSELDKKSVKFIYKKLDKLLKEKNYDWWLALVKYIRNKYKVQDKRLLVYERKFLEMKEKELRLTQKQEYKLELESLKLMFKNGQYDRALRKAQSILRKYPLVEKKEVFDIIKKIHKEKSKALKWWKTIEDFFEELSLKFARLSKKWLLEFYDRMAWFLKSKMDLKFSLKVIYAQTKDYWLKKFVKDLIEWLDAWLKLSEVMAWYKIIGKRDVSLIKMAEKTGKLDVIFTNIAQEYKEAEERKKKIKSVMIYPAIVITVTIIIFTLLLIFIVPKFVKFFGEVWVDLPLITRIIITLSKLIQEKWYIFIAAIIWFIILLKMFFATNPWKWVKSYLALKLPVVKQIAYRANIIYFVSNLWLLLKAWVPLLEALDIIIEWVENKFYKNEFKRIRHEVEIWVNFGKSLWLGDVSDKIKYTNWLIPIDIAYSIDIWERTWQLSDMLIDIWKRYQEDLKLIIKNLQSLMEPFIILLVWGLIFIFVMSIFLPMIKLYDVVGQMWWLK